jgi:formimidoylglutamate deiminase
MPTPAIYEVEHLHQPDGWLSPGYVEIDDAGYILTVSGKPLGGARRAVALSGFGVPGLSNVHSHAFQRALAGRTEFISTQRAEDNLWTWRVEMYRFVERLRPEHYEAIAALVYLEMIKFGFTSVCEFHYVHHQPAGVSYDNRVEMSDRLLSAADRTGISMTLLPVLYCHGGVGKHPTEAQLRFVHSDVDDFLNLVETLHGRRAKRPHLEVGVALHSLRAVSPTELRQAVAGATELDAATRLHIHVSETPHEVAEIQAGLGARPVQWLLNNVDLNQRWTLVHATHIDAAETLGLAQSGAVAGLCPLTEATMGDGYFPLIEYQLAGGAWGIGTDSHYSTSPAEELRILECGKRLQLQRRNVIAEPSSGIAAHSGRRLFDLALSGGERASAHGGGVIAPGHRADLVMLDPNSPVLLAHGPATAFDAWVLSATDNPVRDVMIGGKWVLKDRFHDQEGLIKKKFVQTMAALL